LGNEFAASNPYFDFTSLPESERNVARWEVDDFIKARMPSGAAVNEQVYAMFKYCYSSFLFHKNSGWLDANTHSQNALRCSVFWSETCPHSHLVRIAYPWTATEDTPQIQGLPIDTMYLAKVEELKMEMKALTKALADESKRLEESLSRKFEEQLDLRSVGGEGYGLSRQINEKLEALLKRADTITAHPALPPSPAQPDRLLDIVQEICGAFDGDAEEEEDVCITFEESVAVESVREAAIRCKTQDQLKKRKLTVGNHHGKLNPLPASWRYPSRMNVIQMITLFQMGCPVEGVCPLKLLRSDLVNHFDAEGRDLSQMKRLMKVVQHFAEIRSVWRPRNARNFWNGATVTKLWDGIWSDLGPFLVTETMMADGHWSYHKSRKGQIAWRTCHDKLTRKGVFKELNV
jgi:hypothetical protein